VPACPPKATDSRARVESPSEARRPCPNYYKVVGSLPGDVHLEAHGAGKLRVRRVLEHVFALPDGHGRLRWLRAEPLEQGFGPEVLLELDPDVGQAVAGRELPKARRIARVARAYYPQAHAHPHQKRAPGQEGIEDDVREIELLGDDLLQPLAWDRQHLPAHAHHGREGHPLPGEHVQVAQESAWAEAPHPPRLAGEVVYYLYLALEDDEEVVG
jgi:hypothetical protein